MTMDTKKNNCRETSTATMAVASPESATLFAAYPEVVNIQQVSEMLALSPNTVRALIYQKQLPAKKLGGKWRILRLDVAQLFSVQQDST
jgi:excisionase family DNA binding protein